MQHRGRIQAQGENIEASESWSQEEPPTKKDANKMIENLRSKIPKNEAKIREKAFEKAKQFVGQGPHEVIDKPVTRSFKVKGTKKERVDIEIQKGKAFI